MSTHPQAPKPTSRNAAIDVSRGIIIVLMALDHTRSFISRNHPSEAWGVAMPDYQGDWLGFVMRLVTHLCAPGFFFLMGVSMAFYYQSRALQQGNISDIRKHFAIRGAILIALQFTLVNIAWMFGSLGSDVESFRYFSGEIPPTIGSEDSPVLLYFGVLSALGCSMLILSCLITLGSRSLFAIAALAFVIPLLTFPQTSPALISHGIVTAILQVPSQVDVVLVRYPIFPWIAVAILGYIFGKHLQAHGRAAFKQLLIVSLVALALFVVFRAGLDIGDYHARRSLNWIDILNVTKYPPSIDFLLLTLGINGLILATLGLFYNRPVAPLSRFGSATLFVYVTHLYLYSAIGYLFPEGSSLYMTLIVWPLGLAILYPACVWYGKFKRGKAKSHWVHYF